MTDRYFEDRFGGASLCAIRQAPRQHAEMEVVADLADRVMVLEAEHAAANAVIERLRGALQEAVDGMGGSYAIWSQKAREILTALKTPNV